MVVKNVLRNTVSFIYSNCKLSAKKLKGLGIFMLDIMPTCQVTYTYYGESKVIKKKKAMYDIY